MAKPFSSRLSVLSGWVLVRMHVAASEVLVPVMDGKKMVDAQKKKVADSRATVLDVGPGEYSDNGTLVPPDPRLKAGVTILANSSHFLRFSDIKEMAEENLCFIPASMIVFILAPEGMPATSKPKLALA